MALRHVTRLPDRQEATFIRVDAGKTFDHIIREQARGVARIYERVGVVVNLTRAEMHKQAAQLDPTPLLGVPPSGTHWILESWSSCENFDTPSGNIEPGTYNQTGARETYANKVIWYDDALRVAVSEKLDDVVIQENARGEVETIQRKVTRNG